MRFPSTDSESRGILNLAIMPRDDFKPPPEEMPRERCIPPIHPPDLDALTDDDIPVIDGKGGWPQFGSVRAQPPRGPVGMESRAEYAQIRASGLRVGGALARHRARRGAVRRWMARRR